MTLDEKFAQMRLQPQPRPGGAGRDTRKDDASEPIPMSGGTYTIGNNQGDLQRHPAPFVESTRLGIPCCSWASRCMAALSRRHGLSQAIGLGSTWNVELMEAMGPSRGASTASRQCG